MTSEVHFEGCEQVERVDSGPIADVYRAVQVPLGRKVLIKALGSSILPSSPFAAALEREARLLAALSHPNILGIFDFVRRDERMWLVLEHVDGFGLRALQERSPRLPLAACIAICRALARALEHAHARGIIHRDIEPRSVMLSKQGQIKLTHFSVASEERLPTAPELLDAGTHQVSLAYASPEQILGEPPDPRSDLFSLGVVFFELFTGDLPFGKRDDPNVAQRIRNDPLPPLSRYLPQGSPALERLVQTSLAKLPADRYQSAAEFERALSELPDAPSDETEVVRDALQRAQLLSGSAPSPSARLPKRRSELGRTVSVLGVLGLSLIMGFVALRWFASRNARVGPNAAGQSRLELVPVQAGYLRVVAEPWAEVFVDGETVETTPFARPIPLSPGLHYIKLSHPRAPDERRTITLAAGETLVLDVSMKVPASALAPTSNSAASPAPSGSAATDETP